MKIPNSKIRNSSDPHVAINTRENKQYEKLMAQNTHEVIRESPQRSQHAPSTAQPMKQMVLNMIWLMFLWVRGSNRREMIQTHGILTKHDVMQ